MFVLTLLLGVLQWSGCVPSRAEVIPANPDKRVPVEVMSVEKSLLTEIGDYSGTLAPRKSVTITAEVPGKVLEVPVEEGDWVSKGDLLLKIDEEPYRLAEEQALSNLEGAKLAVAQAESNLAVQTKTLAAQKAQAEAALAMSQARLNMVENGARPEEKRQTRAVVEAAEINRDNAESEYNRVQALYEGNAATKQMLDSTKAAFEAAKAQYSQAYQTHRLVVKGPREEDKDSARAAVRQSQAMLDAANATLDTLEIRERELENARLQVKMAQLAVDNAQLNRSKTVITSPVEGQAVLVVRNIEIGEMAAPGAPLLELMDLQKPRLVVGIPGAEVRFIKDGEKVPVECIGDPKGLRRDGIVVNVGSRSNPTSTTFPVDIELSNEDRSLRAGLICEAYPELFEHTLPLLPRDAIMDTEEGKVVMIVGEDGLARETSVTVVAERNGIAAIKEGEIPAGSKLIVVGERLARDGDAVNIRSEQEPVKAQ